MSEGTSRILIIGVTGNLGHHLALSSLRSSHPTFALVRDTALSDPTKSSKLDALSRAGLIIVKVWFADPRSSVLPHLVRCLTFNLSG